MDFPFLQHGLPYLATFIIFALFLTISSVGYWMAGKRIRGSCGGIAVRGPDGENLSCDTCPNRDKNPKCQKRSKTSK